MRNVQGKKGKNNGQGKIAVRESGKLGAPWGPGMWGRVPMGVGKAGPGSPSCTTPPARSRRSGVRAGGGGTGGSSSPRHQDGDGDGTEEDISPQAGPSPGPTGSASPAARQQGSGSGRDQMPGLQLKAGPRAGKAWPLLPTALLAALLLAWWDGNPLGSADPEFTPNICN